MPCSFPLHITGDGDAIYSHEDLSGLEELTEPPTPEPTRPGVSISVPSPEERAAKLAERRAKAQVVHVEVPKPKEPESFPAKYTGLGNQGMAERMSMVRFEKFDRFDASRCEVPTVPQNWSPCSCGKELMQFEGYWRHADKTDARDHAIGPKMQLSRRAELIEKEYRDGELTIAELDELAVLQAEARARRNKEAPIGGGPQPSAPAPRLAASEEANGDSGPAAPECEPRGFSFREMSDAEKSRLQGGRTESVLPISKVFTELNRLKVDIAEWEILMTENADLLSSDDLLPLRDRLLLHFRSIRSGERPMSKRQIFLSIAVIAWGIGIILWAVIFALRVFFGV